MTSVALSKLCRKCGHEKDISEFGKHKTRADGLRAYCKSCERAYCKKQYAENADAMKAANRVRYHANVEQHRSRTRAYYARNRDVRRAANRVAAVRWRAANPEQVRVQNKARRALVAGASLVGFTARELEQRLSMYPGCWICGAPSSHIDHVKPLSKGGPHILVNLRPCCAPCNLSKRATWPLTEEFLLGLASASHAAAA